MKHADFDKAAELRYLVFPYALGKVMVHANDMEIYNKYQDYCNSRGWPIMIIRPMDSEHIMPNSELYHLEIYLPPLHWRIMSDIKKAAYLHFEKECMTVARAIGPRYIAHRPRAIEILDIDIVQAKTLAFRIFDVVCDACEENRMSDASRAGSVS